MQQVALHPQESRRLAALQALEIMDTAPEEVFDSITQTLALALNVPIALISLVDAERQWFKSRVGLQPAETPRHLAFCSHTILQHDPLVVRNAAQDPRFNENSLVTGTPDIRFYAGIPIRAPGGLPIGTLCAIDRVPREPAERELSILRGLAGMVEGELAHRAAALAARCRVQESTAVARDRETLFQSVFELAPVGIAIVEPDGRFARVNQALCNIVGYTPEELLRLDFQHITHPDDLAGDLDLLRRLIAGVIDEYRLEKRYVAKSGAILWVHLTVAKRANPDGSIHSLVSVIEDITQRKAHEAQRAGLAVMLERQVELRTQELRQLVESTQRRNEQLRLLTEATAMLTAANGIDEVAAILARDVPQVFPGTCGALYCGGPAGYELASQWGQAGPVPYTVNREECWALRRGTEYRADSREEALRCPHCRGSASSGQVCLPVFALGECMGLLTVGWDAAEAPGEPEALLLGTLTRKLGLAVSNLRLREELRRQALHDPLTGLYNRRYLGEFLDIGAAQSRRRQQGISVLLIDLDHFKALNDRHGHDAGDRALVSLASLLKRCLRAGEAAFRYGGEEFLVVLPGTSIEEARQCAERLRREIAKLRIPVGRNAEECSLVITASFGVAACRSDAVDAEYLIASADDALYKAKANGRDRVVCNEGLTLLRSSAA